MDEAEILRQLRHHFKLWHKGGYIPSALKQKLDNLLFYKDWEIAGTVTQSTRQRLWLIKTVGHCQHPGCVLPITTKNPLEQDHIRPAAKGGSNGLHNKQLLCRTHNRIKADTLPVLHGQ